MTTRAKSKDPRWSYSPATSLSSFPEALIYNMVSSSILFAALAANGQHHHPSIESQGKIRNSRIFSLFVYILI